MVVNNIGTGDAFAFGVGEVGEGNKSVKRRFTVASLRFYVPHGRKKAGEDCRVKSLAFLTA